MDNNYITIVIVKDDNGFKEVFTAPGIQSLEEGELVYTEVDGNFRTWKKFYEVVYSDSYELDSWALRMLSNMPGMPPRLEEVPKLAGSARIKEFKNE